MNNSRYPSLNTIPSTWCDQMASQPIWDSWSNQLYPTNLETALYWGNWLRTHNGDLVAAIQRGICYWLNGIEITGSNDDLDAKDYHTELLEKQHKLLQQVLEVALDMQFYGNSFTSVVRTVTRVLKCPKCGQIRYLKSLVRGVDYDFDKGLFKSKCSGCGYKGNFEYKDLPNNSDKRPLRVIHWNPLSITLDHCNLTGDEKIIYTPNLQDKAFIENKAESAALESLPSVLLETMINDEALSFTDNKCLHLALPADSMNVNELNGWGVPAFLPAFKYVVMMLLLERQTEASVKDYILPIRLLFPDPSNSRGGSDPTGMATNVIHMAQFKNTVEGALRKQAFQQSSWQLIPAPVQQLTLGGDGKAVIPVELWRFVKDQLLDSLCIPSEFTRTSLLAGNAPPISLRMFEQTWERQVNAMDDYVNWYLDQCRQLLGWPEYTGSLMRQSITTDPNRMNLMLQMMGEGKISQTTVLRGMYINPKQERKRILEDQINEAKLQQDIQNKLQAAGMLNDIKSQMLNQTMQEAAAAGMGQGDPNQGGGEAAPAEGGAMPPPGPGASTGDPQMDIQNLASVRTPNNVSPEQLQADAQTVASILMATPIGSPRNQIYSLVKSLNPTLYQISKSVLQDIENKARQQGVEQARQGGM